ncbi:MAG: hypothetical protein RL637_669 [Pseudomonadota bacterium]|jgi:dihydrofolate synthase/folylpolyglutamate synthase
MKSRFDNLSAWLQWQENYHPRPIDLGLERTASVFRQLNPTNIKPITITVAGTNGKGSCIAFLEAIYRAAGYKVGSYTSPHILKYNERIKINGLPVTDSAICEAFDRIDQRRAEISLSYFEFGTLAALDIFARAELDIQLLEVGLGGRLDAVNIVDADVAVISSIDIDHTDWLGNTREQIAAEKAGIFRPFKPAIVGDLYPPVSLRNVAIQQQASLFLINQQFSYQKRDSFWDWITENQQYFALPLPCLAGEHQFCNAATTLCAVEQLQSRLPVTETQIHQGLISAQLNGRFQLIQNDISILLDVAHNPQAVTSLRNYLDKYFADKTIYAVFAMMKDKDIASVIACMKPRVKAWFLAPLSNPRAASERIMCDYFLAQGIELHKGFTQFSHSLNAAKQQAKSGDLIVIFGSFFLVSEYLTHAKHF